MLIDNNVLIDVAIDRPPHSLTSRTLIELIERNSTTAYIAWHSVATFYYVVSRGLDGATARSYVTWMTDFMTVVSTGHAEMNYALSLPMGDFEDAMQVAAARAAGVRYVITRNIRDFTNSPILAITPEQALQDLF